MCARFTPATKIKPDGSNVQTFTVSLVAPRCKIYSSYGYITHSRGGGGGAVLIFYTPCPPFPHETGSFAVVTPLSRIARACQCSHHHRRQISFRLGFKGVNFGWPTHSRQCPTPAFEWATIQQSNRRTSRSIEALATRARIHLCNELRRVHGDRVLLS